jgi:hypothetical protein
LIRPELAQSFVLDFRRVQSLGKVAFEEIDDFVRKVGWAWICHMNGSLRNGASSLEDRADFVANRQMAIRAAQTHDRRDEADTQEFAVWED